MFDFMKKAAVKNKVKSKQHLHVASEDHIIMDEAMGSFRRLMNEKHSSKAAEDIAILCRIFTDKLPGHFRAEEENVFPFLMTQQPTHRVMHTIQKLQDEHIRLVLEACGLAKLISQSHNLRNGAARMAMQQFFDDLQQHIQQEDALFGKPANKRPA